MLRDYQQDIYNKIRIELSTHQGVCAVLPCRSGKSYIMKEIVENACKKGSRVLILAHRNILLAQHKNLIKNCRIESVFTEVNHLGEKGPVDLIIIDEAHISGAESYHKVCDYYKCKRILFTATAKRLDGKPLDLADVIINGISADELVERGDIATYDLYAPKLNVSFKNAKMSGYDFSPEDIAEIMMNKKIYGDIIKYYNELVQDRQAIAYCCNIKHSKSICDLFNSKGISATHMDSTTPEKERLQIMQDFKDGKFKVLCNCNLISEGITVPECDCCLLLRPTQSETLYIQQACRCLTPRKDKKAIIIDFVGNCFAHGMPTEKREYSLTEMPRIRNSSREPEILVRTCKNCYLAYKGTNSKCPYCGFENGKTKKQLEEDRKAELEKIKEIKRKKERMEVAQARSFDDLVNLGIKRGYRNAAYWASMILKGRSKKN